MPKVTEVKKAEPKKVNIAWLTISEQPTALGDRFYLSDLFVKFDKENGKLGAITPREVNKLWTDLVNLGYYPNPELEAQYFLQRVCIWCGGDIITFKNPVGEDFEERCNQCAYLYKEG